MHTRVTVGDALASHDMGDQIYALAAEIYSICGITRNGVRATLKHLRAYVDLDVHKAPTARPDQARLGD